MNDSALDHTNTYPPLNLNDSPRSSESSKEKASKLAKAHTDNIDVWMSLFENQFNHLGLYKGTDTAISNVVIGSRQYRGATF